MSRILLLSDLHMCANDSYGYTQRERLDMLIEDVITENEREKVDLILMLGDYSLDFGAISVLSLKRELVILKCSWMSFFRKCLVQSILFRVITSNMDTKSGKR